MKTWHKIVFWIATVIIVVDNLYWQWAIKLIIKPVREPIGGIFGSFITDVAILIVWLWLLAKIYKLANKKDDDRGLEK